jgi:hypothetical protein
MDILIHILMHIIRFLIVLIFFPFVWIFYGIYVYFRVLFTLDKYSISFHENFED